MRVLWITNILFPEISAILVGQKELKSSGGWLLGMASSLMDCKNLELHIATVSPLVNELTTTYGEWITYHTIPFGKGNSNYNKEYEHYWKQIKDSVNPQIIHIHGTECSHGLSYLRACGGNNVIISIQGIKSVIGRYYMGGLNTADVIKSMTISDLFRGSLFSRCKNYLKYADIEKEMIRSVSHVIGRTSWDKAHVLCMNPKVNYHFCNETLRPEFYEGSTWKYDKCTPHSIFLSQSSYPLKGLHQVLKAFPIILEKYPDAQIRIAGKNFTDYKGIRGFMHYDGYGNYIRRLIRQLNIKDKITFTGFLNAEEMKMQYLAANVFICSSCIENSPNSLGEAQILGTPCVASFVGGIPDMMMGDEKHIYRFEEIECLAQKVCEIFECKDEQTDMRTIAMERHSVENNKQTIKRLYDVLLNSPI